jgi:cysteine desulfurase
LSFATQRNHNRLKSPKLFFSQPLSLLAGLQAEIPELVLVGDPDRRLPNTLTVLFPGVSGRKLLKACPRVFASTGSVCHTDREEASTILTGIGINPDQALGAVRLSVGRDTTIEDAEIAAASLVAA